MARRTRKLATAAKTPARDSSPVPWALRVAAVVLAVLGVLPLANIITSGPGLPWWTSAVQQWLAGSVAVGAVALLLSHFFPTVVRNALDRGQSALLAPPSWSFALLVGAATCLLSLYFGWRIFAWQPVTGDEFAQRWQAQLLAAGRLFARSEPHGEFFSTIETLDVNGRWFAQFPIGGPAVLSLGVLSGAPWLINPLLAGLAAVCFYHFIAATSDERTARMSALLFALCPFLLFMAGSEMNHMSSLAFLLLALAALPRWRDASTEGRAMLAAAIAGAALGISATIRPFDAAVVALVIGAFQLRHALSNHDRVRSIAVQCVAAAIPIAILLAANWATVGHPFSFAYDVLNGPEHRPGFHMTPLGFEHTPFRGLYVVSAYLMKLDVGLFAWPVPALLVIVATLALQRHANEWDHLMLAVLGAIMLGYFAYWSESYFMGSRFFFTLVPVLVVFTARVPAVLRDRTRSPTLRLTISLLIPLWVLVAWAAPVRKPQLFGVRQLSDAYRVRATAPEIIDAVRRARISNAVVFLPEGWHARLAARLRALGIRPLLAEQLATRHDACTVLNALGAAERIPDASAEEHTRFIMDFLARDAAPTPLAGQPPSDQLAFVAGRPRDTSCVEAGGQVTSYGVSMAEMLPHETFDADGRLAGKIIYARDFGRRNELLRSRFGDRAWYVARASMDTGALVVQLEPYRRQQ